MSSDKPVSDPQEPEGTGVPADAAAEHTGSDATPKADAATGDDSSVTEPDATSGTAEDSGAGTRPRDPDATERAGDTGAADVAEPEDPTVVAGTSATDETASTQSTGGATAGTEDVSEAGSEETVVVSKSAAESSDKAGSEETVALSKSEAQGSDKATTEETVEPSTSGRSVGEGSDADRQQTGFRLSRPLLAGGAVLLVGALVAVGALFFFAHDRQDELDRRAAATKAACDFGNSFATYTGDRADEYLQRLEQTATGDWQKLIAEIGPDLKARFTETEVDSKAAEVQCGYESGSDDDARVVLVIDQEFTIADAPQDQPPGRVKVAANVDMQKVDGTWMVATFDAPMMQQ